MVSAPTYACYSKFMLWKKNEERTVYKLGDFTNLPRLHHNGMSKQKYLFLGDFDFHTDNQMMHFEFSSCFRENLIFP